MRVGELKQALKLLKPFVAKGSTLPVLANVALHWQDSVCWVSACNLREGARIPVKHEEEFSSVMVSHEVLTKLVKTLDGDVSLEVVGATLVLTAGDTRIDIRSIAYSEFPLLPAVGDPVAVLSAEVIAEVANRVAPAASDDESRPALACVNVEMTPDSITFVATDGFILAKLTVELAKQTVETYAHSLDSERNLLVPASLWKSLAKLQASGTVTLLAPEVAPTADPILPNHMALTWQFKNGTVAHVMVEDHPFPNYRVIVPKDRKSRLHFERKPLAKALTAFKALDTTLTEWQVNGDHAVITARDKDLGISLSKTVGVSVEGEPPKFALAYDLVLDLLKMAGGDSVWLDLNTAGSAMVIRNTSDDHWMAVIMPVKLQTTADRMATL